ncbi:MAG: ATPase, T2SS/T4P/T4SS family [Candidatus Gastranaerophilales bacterium]|nr:ATPase, T2SS/T4P/T4SS family [Candidatus Gastranaerophilales bacterium]
MQDILTNKTLDKLKYDLVREGLISFENLTEAENTAKEQKQTLAKIFVESNFIQESALLKFIESKLHIPSVDLKDYSVDRECLKYICTDDAKRYKIIPLFKIEEVLTVAMSDPLNLFALNNLITTTKCDIEPVICSENSINEAIEKYYNQEPYVEKLVQNITLDWRNKLSTEKHDEKTLEEIIFALLNQACEEKSLEIVFEKEVNGLSVTFNVEQQSTNRGNIPILLMPAFIAKLKKMASLDFTVTNIPQIGKIKFLYKNKSCVASVATLPNIKSERISVKIYKPPKQIDNLITNKGDLEFIEKNINNGGIFVVLGSDLSGKTSVIYSILNSQTNKNILTFESIIKYELPNIKQIQLNEKIGLDLSKAMRFLEFQLPDIIYFESLPTAQSLEYSSTLAAGGKTIFTEFSAKNLQDFIQKFDFSKIQKTLCGIIYVNDDKIEIISKNDIFKEI